VLNTQRIRNAFERAAPGFDSTDFLYREIRGRLLDRLRIVDIHPEWILDLGAGTCSGVTGLVNAFPDGRIIALDFAAAMLAAGKHKIQAHSNVSQLCGEAAALPFGNQSIDLIFSNLVLHHCPNPGAELAEARRVLRFPGLLTFTMLGQDSLIELRNAWAAVDSFSHISHFMDMHHVGDALIQAGFAEPVVDVEVLTVTYDTLSKLIADLRGAGSINATDHRNPDLTGRRSWRRLTDAYEQYRNKNKQLSVTLEIIYGLAWCGEIKPGMRSADGAIEFPVEELKLSSRDRYPGS
jgi:malonyl-CoA O-methyltransferase